MAGNEPVIESVLRENRSFAPPEAFSSTAHIPSMAAYRALCAEAEADPEAFWGRIARENLDWFRPLIACSTAKCRSQPGSRVAS